VELSGSLHPFFVATQAHPEFKSRPNRPHPLFRELVRAALARAEARMPHLPLADDARGFEGAGALRDGRGLVGSPRDDRRLGGAPRDGSNPATPERVA
jgi:hypothetical protein